MTLLAKTRTLNRLLQQAAGQAVNFLEMSEVLKETIQANIYVISRKGKILGSAIVNPLLSLDLLKMVMEDKRFPSNFNTTLLKIEETISDQDTEGPYIQQAEEVKEQLESKYVTIVPVIGAGDRVGTLVLSRTDHAFNDDDLILAEYGSTIVGMEILRERTDEIEVFDRSRAIVQVAVSSLSFSELEAVEHIFDELKGKEGLLIASKIADRVGITRSVIVNALRKLESAGVIETRSLGMKGTYIKILNDQLFQKIDKSQV